MGHDLVSLASALMADERGKLFPGENGDRQDHASLAGRLFKDRRGRDKFFSPELFGEPAWDILLDLYIRMQRGQSMSIGDPALLAGVPPTPSRRTACAPTRPR